MSNSDVVSSFLWDAPPRPRYLDLWASGELARRVERARAELERCEVCPRSCKVDRLHALATADAPVPVGGGPVPGRRQVAGHIPPGTACFTGRYARVSSAFPHFGEEDCLRGWRGSGTIFFSMCNLRCVFCQNWEVSQLGEGQELGPEALAMQMLALQARGCHNINFVTPEHVVPQVLEAILVAAEGGLRLPLVYNTSAYDSAQSLRLLDGVVDIYMPDFKYWDSERARKYLKAADYPVVARRVVKEMHRQVGPLRFDRHGIARTGILVRHLVMPDGIEDAAAIFDFLAAELGSDTYVNVMDQYYPAGSVQGGRYPELARLTAPREVDLARREARRAGLWRLDERVPRPLGP